VEGSGGVKVGSQAFDDPVDETHLNKRKVVLKTGVPRALLR
jgi:hypothetical protein